MRSFSVPRVLVYALLLAAWWWPDGRPAAAAAQSSSRRTAQQVRESVLAGTWYPASKAQLQDMIGNLLQQAPESAVSGRLLALIVPHAGYRFSGQVAAYAYKLLPQRRFETVVILAPSHYIRFAGVSVYDRGGYRTPLGLVPLDRQLISDLQRRDPELRHVPEAHAKEHALEIQLPFLQTVLPTCRLVPLVMGDQSYATCRQLAAALVESVRGKSVLLIASSDLSHFHTYDQAKTLDQELLNHVRHLDPQGLSDSLAAGACEACGGGPMVTVLLAARQLGATAGQVLDYANSGDVTGDRQRVVGYLAAAITAKPKSQTGPSANGHQPEVSFGLTDADKVLLHRIAKDAIAAHCQGKPMPKVDPASPVLQEPRGAFVTLRRDGQLRGCIGSIAATRPLAETVAEMAVAAAFSDPRFEPLTPGELKDLQIEISVLSPLHRITRPDEIQVGVHGIYLQHNGRSGLLLPQVATEYGWDRVTFLQNTCRKALLPKNAWQNPQTRIYIFSAEVF